MLICDGWNVDFHRVLTYFVKPEVQNSVTRRILRDNWTTASRVTTSVSQLFGDVNTAMRVLGLAALMQVRFIMQTLETTGVVKFYFENRPIPH